uniref:Putative reverse transcriptase protein n=2 Tax=Roya TaxID=43942 RepID=A0A024B4I5_9VIRI|nr:putative reverse transcriptase protein [Roya anglica]YP_009256895.1 putative reverse transcriptase [Roya obtusa]AHZ11116.1 putative reverse transcriptase protein [Roya anglica]ANI25996.1 putative reverse transcriptase [Roya obtusa]
MKNLIKTMLEIEWEIFISKYINENKNKFLQNHTSSYVLQVKPPSIYNYLLLAKIIDSICIKKNIQFALRKCVKIDLQTQYLKNTVKISEQYTSIFRHWLFKLFIPQLKDYIKRCTLNLYKPIFTNTIKRLKITHYRNNLLITSRDLLSLQACQYITHQWFSKMKINIKPYNFTIFHSIIKLNGQNFVFFNADYELRLLTYQYINNRYKIPQAEIHVFIKKILNKIFKQKYINNLKYIINRNKMKDLLQLIYILNQNIRHWNQYFYNNLCRNQYIDLNHILYKYLVRWGIYHNGKQGHKIIHNSYYYPDKI